jgi:tol-pal system protein YbgF
MFDLQEDTVRLQSTVDSLRAEQRAASDTLCSIQSQLRDMNMQSTYGSNSLQEKMQALAAQMDDIVSRMDRTLAPLEEYIRKQTASNPDTGKSSGSMGVDYYDAAVRDLSLGNYDLAEVGFLQYLDSNPKSDLADDARYGLGETYYNRQRYDEAITEYQKVIQLNASGGKAPAAMLKIGLCHKAKGTEREAKKAWQDLIKQFPNSEESRVAQQRIDELKKR